MWSWKYGFSSININIILAGHAHEATVTKILNSARHYESSSFKIDANDKEHAKFHKIISNPIDLTALNIKYST